MNRLLCKIRKEPTPPGESRGGFSFEASMWWIVAGIIVCAAIGIGMRSNEGDLTSDQAGSLLIGLIAVAALIFIGALFW